MSNRADRQPVRLYIPHATIQLIGKQAETEAPNEACGYLFGINNRVTARYQLTNVDHSPEHYSFDPREQFAAIKHARQQGWRVIGTYHSHPQSAARMSQEDIRLANDPDIYYLIYSIPEAELRAYSVDRDRRVGEIIIDIIDADDSTADDSTTDDSTTDDVGDVINRGDRTEAVK